MTAETPESYWYTYWNLLPGDDPTNAVYGLPLLSRGPLVLGFSAVSFAWLVRRYVFTKSYKKTPPGLKFFLRIYYALMILAPMGFIVLAATLTDFFENTLATKPLVLWTEMRTQGVLRLYLYYIYFIMSLVEVVESVLTRKGNLRLTFHFLEMAIIYFVLKEYHFDSFFLVFSLICLLKAFNYLYEVCFLYEVETIFDFLPEIHVTISVLCFFIPIITLIFGLYYVREEHYLPKEISLFIFGITFTTIFFNFFS